MIIHVHVVLFICSDLLGTVSSQCLNNCDCLSQHGADIELQCNGRNLASFPLASALPENVTIIKYQDNKIQKLPKQPHGLRKTEVWSINLAGNVMDILLKDNLGKTFPNLSYLDLSNNKISSLSNNSFRHLINLNGLYLSSNKLKRISQGWFSHLVHLSHINLANNEISVIEETTGTWPKRLSNLDLHYNKLKAIPPLPRNASVNLLGNPVFCGCHLKVNKNITETFIKVDCQRLGYYRENVTDSIYRNFRYRGDKYIVRELNCQQAKIINLMYSVAEEKMTITCVTSHGYPEPSVTVYYRDRKIAKSRNNVTMDIAKSGLYACKITNYISSDQRQLFIPELSTSSELPSWTVMTESEVNQATPNIEALKTEDNTTRLETTSPSRRRQEDAGQSVGTCKFIILLAAQEVSSTNIFTIIIPSILCKDRD